MDEATLERGVALVKAFAIEEPPVRDVVDLLEAELGHPDAIRAVLKRAEAEGVIERRAERIVQSGAPQVPSDDRPDIVTKEGEFACRRCGQSLSTGYFLTVLDAEVGPYGSTCIKKVTGRID